MIFGMGRRMERWMDGLGGLIDELFRGWVGAGLFLFYEGTGI
jgi:hypothetical protein